LAFCLQQKAADLRFKSGRRDFFFIFWFLISFLVASISCGALEFVLGASRSVYPREFVGLLRGEGDRVDEVLFLPSSTFGEGFSSFSPFMMPFDGSVVGSVHSHPSGSKRPSGQDLVFFSGRGGVHLIVAYPSRSLSDVACYDGSGELMNLGVF
jgi:proteasome lid subunit RPN8/RPN11